MSNIGYLGYKDTTGAVHGFIDNSGAPQICVQQYLQAIAEGDITGHTLISKTGYGPAATAAETTLWNPGTAYVFPTANISVEVISTSANDDGSPAGTGANTVVLNYLSSDYNVHTTTLTMNGTTAVAGPTDFFRTNEFYVTSAGSLKRAAGVISLRLVGGAATVYDQIAAGYNASRNSVYTVPLGKIVYIHDIMFSCAYSTAGKSERMILQTTCDPLGVVRTDGLFFPHYEAMLLDYSVQKVVGAPIKCPEKTDIKVSIIGETNAQSTCSYSGWIE